MASRELEELSLDDEQLALLDAVADRWAEAPARARQLIESAPRAWREHPEFRRAHALTLLHEDDLRAAECELQALVDAYPEFADAHADLAEVAGLLGDERRQIEHWLVVHRLDSEQDREAGLAPERYEGLILETVRTTLDELPREFRDKLASVPVMLEQRPALDLVHEGFDPRSLGLFEGLDHAGHLNHELAMTVTRIVLYTANLAAVCDDEEEIAREVRITVLHEVGHYFGLDEADMERLGLD